MDIVYTKRSVLGILERLHQLVAAKERGNVDAIVALVDVGRAIKKCEFTEMQKKVYRLHFIKGCPVKDVAKILKISHTTVVTHKRNIGNLVHSALVGGATA